MFCGVMNIIEQENSLKNSGKKNAIMINKNKTNQDRLRQYFVVWTTTTTGIIIKFYVSVLTLLQNSAVRSSRGRLKVVKMAVFNKNAFQFIYF